MPAKPKIAVTRRLPDAVEARIRTQFDARLNPADRLYKSDELLELAAGMDGLLICLTEPFPAQLIDRLPASVKIISTFSVGTNHIDVAAAKRRGIVVTNTPQAVTEATADATLLLMLAAARRAHEFQAQMRNGDWKNWVATGMLGTDISGKRLGIIGYGRIGQAVARRARGFGMEIHYHSRNRVSPEAELDAVYHPTLASLLAASQVVSLHSPTTPETRNMINKDTLALLPPGAILVNTARGDQVADDDLIAALASGRLAAAGLDVYNNEPDFDKRYLDLPNVFLTPHIGTSTRETRDHMGFDATANLEAFFAGKEPPFRVV